MNAAHALANLVDARDALSTTGARPFIVDGTLLGAVREGGFIAHDTDVDLGCFIEDQSPEMIAAMEWAGFTFRKQYGTASRGLEYSFRRHDIKLDLFFYYTDDRGRFHAAWKKRRPIRYRYPLFHLAPLEFMGETFMAPEDPETFLVAKYGPRWRTPVVDWDWAWGPANAERWVEA
jgi:hypothetical protein